MSTAKRAAGYAPRNALNAGALKSGIAARSQARGDDAAVRAWLLNHFYRHLVANYEPAIKIDSLADARQVLRSEAMPEWVAARFGASAKASSGEAATPPAPVVWVDPVEPRLLALEARLVEFLTSRKGTALDGKLDRVTCPQALALWDREHAEMATRIERGWRQSQPEALRTLLSTPNGAFVELLPDSALLRAEMAFESYVMRHCLGQFSDRRALSGGYGERYAEAVAQQRLRLLSLRDASGQPHITISVHVLANGALAVDQVKGKQNRPPIARYVEDVLACLNALGTDEETPDDCIAIGVVRTPAGWARIEDVTEATTQTRLVARYPQLFVRLSAPTPMVEWLVAARQPGLLAERSPRAASVRYATRPTADPHGGEEVVATEGVPWPELSLSQAEAILALPSKS
ncbi:hypothetical protein [Cupriavidus sp. CuC1]|uniref:hypothetical protein n=1 Tax=Cupriavidus sp. CuC1 TaxID=3373131 RepID=UPI0037D04085